ncbi:hypothetical protein EGD00_02240 [Pectobacterium carotovorum subsp. carotovorum]|nr:hypothetical protein EGD00_02240 [Pectobacterium carotovorum subsp. carotovorum]
MAFDKEEHTYFVTENGEALGDIPRFVPALFSGMEVILRGGSRDYCYIVKTWKYEHPKGLIVVAGEI